jgi:hypothetical protein
MECGIVSARGGDKMRTLLILTVLLCAGTSKAQYQGSCPDGKCFAVKIPLKEKVVVSKPKSRCANGKCRIK